jgi:hypothetical protein
MASINEVNMYVYPEQKIHHAAPRMRAEIAHSAIYWTDFLQGN